MIMAIYASATPGHTQKELTADLNFWTQMLIPKAPHNPRKSSPLPPGLIYLPVPSCPPFLALLRVELCARP